MDHEEAVLEAALAAEDLAEVTEVALAAVLEAVDLEAPAPVASEEARTALIVLIITAHALAIIIARASSVGARAITAMAAVDALAAFWAP